MLSKLKKINFKTVTYKALICFFCLLLGFVVTLSLYTHNDFDPSIFTVNDEPPLNALGLFGSNLSSVLALIESSDHTNREKISVSRQHNSHRWAFKICSGHGFSQSHRVYFAGYSQFL